ncbi:MAG: leucyl/phenylalanyl-tRNA--protein transferase [Bacteroidota bacterium]
MPLFGLSDEHNIFPDPHLAEPSGLLAIGGDLSTARLKAAYQQGIFPWFSEGEPILWWSPDPRCVLYPDQLKVSKSMRQVLRKGHLRITMDQAFSEVIARCKSIPREGQQGTWITKDMQAAYIALHEEGWAHSVEVWQDEQLVAGLYGISMGACFFGESMFTEVSNGSKAGFITLVGWLKEKGFQLIDCQVHTPHLESLGAILIPRQRFLGELNRGLAVDSLSGNWSSYFDSSSS